MKLFTKDIAKMIDISCVRSYMNRDDIRRMAQVAMEYKFICAHVLPSNVPFARELLDSDPDVMVGCPVGFPGGGVTTATKVFEMQECIKMGADEIDAVMNIGWIRSGRYKEAEDDISQVIKAAGGRPIKTIIVVMTLSDEQITQASKIAENAMELLQTISRLKPTSAKGTYMKSVFLSSTMSPGVQIDTKII